MTPGPFATIAAARAAVDAWRQEYNTDRPAPVAGHGHPARAVRPFSRQRR